MVVQLSLETDDIAPTAESASGARAFAPDLAYRLMSIVNVIFYGDPSKGNDWVLIDTGLPTSKNTVVETAEARFGRN
ncbi:hypothetical protein SB659_19530, partial [Arthrobacter sp. SIMBA_036]|uniref:hypothetical protein n=1 Tax=Arthrobacter sp. SIMBA_036 TaxID=3085778 RepID=UPI003978FABE